MTDIRERLARQLTLEGESRDLGAERYRAQRPLPWRTDASAPTEEAELPPGRQLIKLVVEPVAEAVREFVHRIHEGGSGRRPVAFSILSRVEPGEAAFLAARVIVNGAVLSPTMQAVANSLADALIHHIEMSDLKSANGKGYKGLLKAQERAGYSAKKKASLRKLMEKEGTRFRPTPTERLAAGLKMIELVCDVTGLFTTELVPNRTGFVYVVRPTETCRDWLERQHARCEILEPLRMPMVVRPRRWRSPTCGGYLTTQPGKRMVKQWNKPYHEELRYVEMPEVYSALNNIQDTPWAINGPVLDVMREVWDGGGALGGLPRREDHPLPPRPDDLDTNEEALKAWKADAATTYTQNAQLLSKRLAISQKLWVAQKFRDEEAIWFPHELDFRGRVYPLPVGGPHPQGDDSAKGLLRFAKGHPLGPTGGAWLAIHIANLFGIDKVTFDDRVDWVMENSDAICDSAESPLDGHRFWTTADSPYCALAACIEWAGYCREGEAFVSHIPVALDGSNSGLQHFSAMLRDPVGGAAVNLIPSDKPQDVYAQVAAVAMVQVLANTPPPQELVDDTDNPERLAEWLAAREAWRASGITRKIAKRPCMTYVYSATRFGMHGMVVQALREIDKENAETGKPPYLGGADNYKAAMYLSHILWDAISEVVSAAADAMSWLRETAKIAAETGTPLWWTSPLGLPVLQGYRMPTSERVAVHFAGRRIKLTVMEETLTINKRAQANGIAPNFVHSLDAAHLMASVNACVAEGIADLAVIHDSFGCHAAFAGRLSEVLRETLVAQYTPNRLEIFRDDLVAQLPPELAERIPPLPALGTLDLNEVLSSHYVFA